MTFEKIASKLQDELADIIVKRKDVNDYELIVYRYMFKTELGIPILEELEFEITEDSFILHVIPDDFGLDVLRNLDDCFDRFTVTFMPNSYNVLKLRFRLSD